MNREQYLNEAARIVSERLFKPNGYSVPKNIRYSTSFPSNRAIGAKNKTIGQCWADSASDDNHFEIFISPLISDKQQVLGTLIHEIVHATVGLEHGHKGAFKQCALAVGLEGKMTATNLSDETFKQIDSLIGEYPHAKLNASSIKKQSTRMKKAICSCGYGPIRLSRKILEIGLPICPVCEQTMIEG